jgi:hypothetical protein
VGLLVVSTVFVMTALAYLIVPSIVWRASQDPGLLGENPGTGRLASWLDQHGPTALAGQFGLMVVLSLAAMATDHWFVERRDPPLSGSAS